MDIGAQILLNSTMLLLGIFLLLPFLSQMNPLLYVSLSWFTGWGISGAADMLMVIAGVSVTITKIALVAFSILVIIYIFCRYQGKYFSRDLKKYFVLAGLFCGLVFVFCLLAGFENYMHYSTDSITYEGLSRIFHNYGVFADGRSRVYYWLFNVRLPFYIAVHNIAYLSGINVFYSFLSGTTIMTSLMIAGFWSEHKRQPGFYTFLWLSICFCFFISNKLIIFHSFYSLSNLTNMAYYSAGILCLNLFRKKQEPFWFLIACFFLGITGIIRKEMLLFSLIPYLFLFRGLKKPDVRMLLAGFAVYVVLSYSWFFWGIFYLKDWAEMLGDALKTTSHGGVGIVGFCFITSIIAFFMPQKIINIRGISLLYFALSVTIIIAFIFYFYGNALIQSARNLVTLMFKGAWGTFWFSFVSFSGIIATVGLFFKLVKKQYNFSFDWFLPCIIVVFFIFRILLYTVFTSPIDDGWNSSGNRILMHVMLICVFWMGQAVQDMGLVRISE